MLKLFAFFCFASAANALTKKELPRNMQECIDNVMLPLTQMQDELHDKCEAIGATEYESYKKCTQPGYDKFNGADNINCLVIKQNLPKVQSVFVDLYIRKVLYKDDYSKIPKKLSDCLNQVKLEMKGYFELIQECEPLLNLRSPTQSEEFIECQKKNGKKVKAFEPSSELKNCMAISHTVSSSVRQLVDPYTYKVMYDL